VEKKLSSSPTKGSSAGARAALAIDPINAHAETENFVVHYRRATRRRKSCARWSTISGSSPRPRRDPRRYQKNPTSSFLRTRRVKRFLDVTNNPMKWSVSYAHGDELFLMCAARQSRPEPSFDSHTLAMKQHAVVARLYPRNRWPLWLNEVSPSTWAAQRGRAERAAVAPYERDLHSGDMPLSKLCMLHPTDRSGRAPFPLPER